MSLHTHEHGHCRDVSKDNDEICPQDKKFLGQPIESTYTPKELQKFAAEWPKEGVDIEGFFGK